MPTVICVDGLGGYPPTTFGSLKQKLETVGHIVILIDTSRVVTHEDRLQLVIEEYERHEGDIFLLGQSAGGSSVRITAERLEKKGKKIAGVILLSPAMPRWIFFMTQPLWRVIKGRLLEILQKETIRTKIWEYRDLVSPVASEMLQEVMTNRQPISGDEARTLAFFPPKFIGYSYPTLHLYGDMDTWIAPQAQKKLSTLLAKKSPLTSHVIAGTGHLTLASKRRNQVIQTILDWIVARSSS